MLRIKKLPWASLEMMILTYGVFGWLMSASTISPWLPLLGAFYLMVVITILTLLSLRNLQTQLDSWFQSKLRSLITLILGAFAMAVIVSWLEIFIRTLVLLAAALLVRIDLIAQGFSRGHIFLVLSITALGSYGMAVFIHGQLAIVQGIETTFLW